MVTVMNNDPRGILIQQGNFMRIENAFVEEVNCFDTSEGNIVVSYAVRENDSTSIQNIQLNLNNRTTVLDASGQNICLCCIQPGSWVNVIFSSRMTRSIPPQANAFLVAIQQNSGLPTPPFRPQRPQPPERPMPQPSSVTTGRIVLVDFYNNYFITEAANNANNQTRFNVNDTTTYTNQRGNAIRFQDLQPGQWVRVTHANFQTASIPPQTTAFQVQLL